MKVISAHSPRFSDSTGDRIDCSVLFDGFSNELPFTAFRDDVEAHSVELFSRCIQGEFGPVVQYVAPQITSEQIVTAFDTALTAHLDATAQQRRYDNRITCMVRAGFPGPFQAEGVAFATWCDECNILAYQMLAAVQAGTEPMPESPAAFIATLPVMVWP